MKSICKTLLFVTLILLFNSCNTTEYSSAQTLKIAVHSILDPAKNITVFFWQTKVINMEFEEDITNDLFIIELFENGDLIASALENTINSSSTFNLLIVESVGKFTTSFPVLFSFSKVMTLAT